MLQSQKQENSYHPKQPHTRTLYYRNMSMTLQDNLKTVNKADQIVYLLSLYIEVNLIKDRKEPYYNSR